MNLDAEQRAYLRALLRAEQDRLRMTLRLTLHGAVRDAVEARNDLIDRTLSDLEN